METPTNVYEHALETWRSHDVRKIKCRDHTNERYKSTLSWLTTATSFLIPVSDWPIPVTYSTYHTDINLLPVHIPYFNPDDKGNIVLWNVGNKWTKVWASQNRSPSSFQALISKNVFCNTAGKYTHKTTDLRTDHSNLTHTQLLAKREPTGLQHIWHTHTHTHITTKHVLTYCCKFSATRQKYGMHSKTAAAGSRLYSSCKKMACTAGYDTLRIQSLCDLFATP
jgi:hypothetical protein